jgi:propionyl-CoA synthetase
VVGHSYIVYAPLLHGATSILYEGKPVGTPDAGAFWRVISEHKARGAVHRADRVPRHQEGRPAGQASSAQYDLSKFRTLFLAGERADPRHGEMGGAQLKVPVIDHWWQTETGWCIAGNPVGSACCRSSTARRRCRCRATTSTWSTRPASRAARHHGLDRDQAAAAAGLPADAVAAGRALQGSYLAEFPGYYKTADAGYKDEDGYVYVMGRTDDIINVAGHRLSTGGMEEVLAAHPDVAECAVLGIKDAIKGEVPCGFLVLKAGVRTPNSPNTCSSARFQPGERTFDECPNDRASRSPDVG